MSELHVVDRPHSQPFSPSGADIALSCSKSVEFTLGGARRAPHGSAAPGTAQHTAFEVCWHRGIEPDEIPAVWVGGGRITLTPQDREAITFALAWCRPRFTGRRVVIERLLRLPWGGLFGYADLITLDAPLTVLDLKFGWWPVYATSTQLGIYCLMLALEVYRSIEGEGCVRAIIIQPRSPDPIREHEWEFSELRALRDRLIALFDRIRRKEFEFGVGPHCRWCAAAGVCPALAATARDAAAAAVAPPQLVASGEVSQERVDEMAVLAPVLEHLARQARATARQYLLAGGRLQHLKLVRQSGRVVVADREDPRPEVIVTAVLEAARQSMLAASLKSAVAK